MLISQKLRLYPTPDQQAKASRLFGLRRLVWNSYLDFILHWGLSGEAQPTAYDLQKHVPHLRELHPELNQMSVVSIRAVIDDLVRGFDLYRKDQRLPRHQRRGVAHPRFKSRKFETKSFRTSQHVRVAGSMIQLQGLGLVEYVGYKPLPDGCLKQATVTLTPTGKWHASVTYDDGVPVPEKPKIVTRATALDMGLTHLATDQTGRKIVNPRHAQKAEERLARLQRIQKRRTAGSLNYRRRKRRIARLCEKVATSRKYFLDLQSFHITRETQAVIIEDLQVGNMVRGQYSKGISDAGWGYFRKQLEWKCKQTGRHFVAVPAAYTSMECPDCHWKMEKKLPIWERSWTCQGCGITHDRDHAAARIILQRGSTELSADGHTVVKVTGMETAFRKGSLTRPAYGLGSPSLSAGTPEIPSGEVTNPSGLEWVTSK